jgi:hypothetical protein
MIYTAITSGIDQPRNDVKVFSEPLIQPYLCDRLSSKVYKILGHLFVKCPSIWVDVNITLNVPEKQAMELLYGYDLVVFKHPYRKCVSEEVSKIIECGYMQSDTGKEFLQEYPDVDKYGLFEAGVIMRSSYKMVARLNEIWWSLICRWSIRDQITLPIAIMQVPQVRVNVVDANIRNHPFFTLVYHVNPPLPPFNNATL